MKRLLFVEIESEDKTCGNCQYLATRPRGIIVSGQGIAVSGFCLLNGLGEAILLGEDNDGLFLRDRACLNSEKCAIEELSHR